MVSFCVVAEGEDGFAVGVVDEAGKKSLEVQLGGKLQIGAADNTWGWAAYNGQQSDVAMAGGWHKLTDKWNRAGTEVTLRLNCDVGSVSVAIASSSMQEAFVHKPWAGVPLQVGWHLRNGS